MRRFEPITDNKDLKIITKRLRKAISELERATTWILETYEADANSVLSGAVDYLDLLGTTLGGWVLGRSAEISLKNLESKTGDPSFFKSKINSARFFADHVLVDAPASCEKVISGASSITSINFYQAKN